MAIFTVSPGLETSGWLEIGELLGFLFLVVAALGRVWAYAYIGGRKNAVLCQSGPYAMNRNPLYFFSFLGVLGACLALKNLLLLFVAVPAFLLLYHYVIAAEESRLKHLFGSDFVSYCHSTPRFWPKFSSLDRQGTIDLNVRLFTRGLGEVFWFLSFVSIADGLEWLHAHNVIVAVVLPF